MGAMNALPLLLIGAAALIVTRKKGGARRQVPHTGTIRIGLFTGSGSHANAVAVASKFLNSLENVELTKLTTNSILKGKLGELDVVLFPGGSGSRQGKTLGGEGREAIREFVRNGGGYIGICAGSYLASQGDDSKLKIVNFYNKTGANWKRGNKDVLAEADVRGRVVQFKIHFENGPIFNPTNEPGIPAYVPLGIYLEETYSTQNGTHKGDMIGTPVVVASSYGNGRVLLFSPNPMLGAADALQFPMFMDAMRWVTAKGGVPPDLTFDEVFPSKI